MYVWQRRQHTHVVTQWNWGKDMTDQLPSNMLKGALALQAIWEQVCTTRSILDILIFLLLLMWFYVILSDCESADDQFWTFRCRHSDAYYTQTCLLSLVSLTQILSSHSTFGCHASNALHQCFLTVCLIIMSLWWVILGQILFLQHSVRSCGLQGQMFTLISSWRPLRSLCFFVVRSKAQVVWPAAIEHIMNGPVVYFERELPLYCGWSAEWWCPQRMIQQTSTTIAIHSLWTWNNQPVACLTFDLVLFDCLVYL